VRVRRLHCLLVATLTLGIAALSTANAQEPGPGGQRLDARGQTPARAATDSATHEVLVIVGAKGEETFDAKFRAAATAWQEACKRAGARCDVVGGADGSPPEASDDRGRVERWLAAKEDTTSAPLWLVYVGHGTFDGKVAQLNVRGKDISMEELDGWLKRFTKRTVIVIHGGSASAPAIPALAAPNRIVISATRSGEEVNYARFGERFAESVANPAADIDQDGQTSLLEAFLTASKHVQSLYAEGGRMATEHALIDDNGDKQGTAADWFKGTRLVKRPDKGGEADGLRAGQIVLVGTEEERALSPEQRSQREHWEKELAALRRQKESMNEKEYWLRVEEILRKLAAMYGADSAPARP
jgi:hypothetical protein